jgi:hypothetical protein
VGDAATHNRAWGGWGTAHLWAWDTGGPDGHGDDLYSFGEPGGAGGWGLWTRYATGALDSSVSTRWAQFHHHWPGTLDIAYWADAYPNQVYVGVEVLGSLASVLSTGGE